MMSGICKVVDAEVGEQLASDGRVVRLAWAQAEAEDLPEARGNQMNLGVELATGATDALRAPFLRAPVPSGCTLMLVLSRLTTSILTFSSCSICSYDALDLSLHDALPIYCLY